MFCSRVLLLTLFGLTGGGVVAFPATLPAQGFGEELSEEAREANRQAATETIDRFWRLELEHSPFLASSHGIRAADRLFPQEGLDSRQRQAAHEFQLLKEVNSLDTRGLTAERKLDVLLLAQELGLRLDGYRLNVHLTPIHQRGGPQIWLPTFHEWMRFDSTRDYENYLSRLRGIPAYLRGVRELLDRGMEKGRMPPAVTQVGVLEQFDAHLVSEVPKSLFYVPFEKFPKAISEEDRSRLSAEGKKVIGEDVLPALKALRDFLAEVYQPSCRSSIGAIDLPHGEDLYAHYVRRHTTTYKNASAIHLEGMKEVSRIRKEMQKVMERIGFEGDFAAFIAHLRTDPKFYHTSAEDLLTGYRDLCKRIDALLPKYFGKLPRIPYGVRAIPDYEAPRATTAYYRPAPADGTQPGWFYANTYDLASRPIYEMVALTLHEAVPGHHLQIALANELDISPFRKSLHFTAYIEGWALYAESLGMEMGLYEDPYDDFGRLSYEMWRALRLVVDTGIHQYGWTRDQAIDLMLQNSALTRKNIEAEVDRYIAWPGQALAYKIGEMEIQRLRKSAEETLGAAFDLRAFHDHLLSGGALPLAQLTFRMEAWIQERATDQEGGR